MLSQPQAAAVRIHFVTTGVLLRRLMRDPTLAGVSHVVVDEVHERDLDSDFLLTLLRRLLRSAPQSAPQWASQWAQQSASKLALNPQRKGQPYGQPASGPPQVILMSATLNTELFAAYFAQGEARGAPIPVLSISGHMFPVRELFLEDVVAAGHVSLHGLPLVRSQAGSSRLSLRSRGVFESRTLLALASPVSQAHGSHPMDASTVADTLRVEQGLEAARVAPEAVRLLRHHCQVDQEVPNALAARVVDWLIRADPLASTSSSGSSSGRLREGAKGTILVFLPGTADITAVGAEVEALLAARPADHKVLVLPLHGSLATADQHRVFAPALPGQRKVVLATNIAESSITIDDAVYVVDSGKVKERRFAHGSGVSSLRTQWCSRASARQRLGRAGRVLPGLCVRLFTRPRLAALADFAVPEMRRLPLEELCLTVKGLGSAFDGLSIAAALATTLEPPDGGAVAAAVAALEKLGALGPGERLTRLGQRLAKLPLDPRTGNAPEAISLD